MPIELDLFEVVERIGPRLDPESWTGAELVAPSAQEHRNEIMAAIERGATEDEIDAIEDRQTKGKENRERRDHAISQIWNAITDGRLRPVLFTGIDRICAPPETWRRPSVLSGTNKDGWAEIEVNGHKYQGQIFLSEVEIDRAFLAIGSRSDSMSKKMAKRSKCRYFPQLSWYMKNARGIAGLSDSVIAGMFREHIEKLHPTVPLPDKNRWIAAQVAVIRSAPLGGADETAAKGT